MLLAHSPAIVCDFENENCVFLFDLDGVIVDSDEANFNAYVESIKQIANLDTSWLVNAWKGRNGRFTRTNLQAALPMLGEDVIQKVIDRKESLFPSFLKSTKVNNEVVKVLSKYSKTNKCYLVSNSREKRARQILEYYELTSLFHDFIFGAGTDTGYNKYEYAARNFNMDKNKTLIFENEEKEIRNAEIAGFNNIIKQRRQKLCK